MIAPDYIICTRAQTAGQYTGGVGQTQYLKVPHHACIAPEHAVPVEGWMREIRDLAMSCARQAPGSRHAAFGDVLVYVHGYSAGPAEVIARHRRMKTMLLDAGWNGVLVSFDWPTPNEALNYLDNRTLAKITALEFVTGGIEALVRHQTHDCTINIHLLAHSGGAFIVREAFDDADDRRTLCQANWMVSQCIFVGADISTRSLSLHDSSTQSLYRHCTRVTNYSNGSDDVLKLSNAKRFGMAPRAGRSGLPEETPTHAINVDCTAYWRAVGESVPPKPRADRNHIWFLSDPGHGFINDLVFTLKGDLARTTIPTRKELGENRFELLATVG